MISIKKFFPYLISSEIQFLNFRFNFSLIDYLKPKYMVFKDNVEIYSADSYIECENFFRENELEVG